MPTQRAVWSVASKQYERITYAQLLELGFHPDAIRHRVKRGRLHRVATGVYAVGRPRGTAEERWMTATLACGPLAVLSHGSAAALWGFGPERTGRTELSMPAHLRRRRPELTVHYRSAVLPAQRAEHRHIRVTSPALTLIDTARRLGPKGLEGAISDADVGNVVHSDVIRATAEAYPRLPGSKLVRDTLDRSTFRLTRSELERLFLRLVRDLGLPMPSTRQMVNGVEVDFHWPELGLIVETDGLRYHRTPAQQSADRRRDQMHIAAGLTPLRFTHAQVRYRPDEVRATLSEVFKRLSGPAPTAGQVTGS